MTRLAVLASGEGSNFEAIARACQAGRLEAEVVGLLCNVPEAGAIARAARLRIPSRVLDHRAFPDRQEHERAMLEELAGLGAEWIALAGYMRVLGPGFVAAYRGRILNIHPADTRVHRGAGGYQWAIARGLSETAATVHFVDEGLDGGPVVLQAPIPISPDDTVSSLTLRGLAIEHELYVRALRQVFAGARLAGAAT